jgi:hypothetical protein
MIICRINTCAECPYCAPIVEPVAQTDAFVCAHPTVAASQRQNDRLSAFDSIPAWCPIRTARVQLAIQGGK